MPTPRNLAQELQGISAQLPGLTGSFVDLQRQYNPQLSAANVGAFRASLLGQPAFDAQGYLATRPDLAANYAGDAGYAGLYGSLENYAQADFDAFGQNDPRFQTYNNTGAIGLAREAWRAANPELANYTQGLGGTMAQLNGAQPGWMDASGYTAALAGPASAGPAAQAGYQAARYRGAQASTASGGPLLGSLERDAAGGLGQTGLERGLQGQAQQLLGAGGSLTAGELAAAQQDARAAYASRGLMRSNRGIGAEILATDSARRNRMFENAQFASGISGQLEGQQNARRQYALGVQGQGQQLSQYNAGLLTNTATFNAGQQNATSQFNAGQRNQLGMYNAGQTNQQNQYNAGLLANLNQFNAGQQNQAGQFNAGATNQSNQFNQNLRFQNNDQQWQRALQYGQFQQGQAINPLALASQLTGQAPDYTGGLLSYGSDLNNTNFNGQAAAEIAKRNNSSSLWGAGLGALGTVFGGPIGGMIGSYVGGKLGGGG